MCFLVNFAKGLTKPFLQNISGRFLLKVVFFFYLGFLSRTSQFTGQQVKREAISLIPHYHFHPLHRHLDIIRVITAESSPLHIVSSRARTVN